MKQLLPILLLILGMAKANACNFTWSHYGEDPVRDIISQSIGSHVTEAYCARFSKNHEIVLQFNNYYSSTGCLGHGVASIRKKGSKTQQATTNSSYVSNSSCTTIGESYNLAARAALRALDNLMSVVDSYEVTK